MKRFLIIILILAFILLINACSFDGEPDPTNTEHIHDFKNKHVIAPTCVNDGYTLLICDCGELMRTAYVTRNGHEFTDVKVILPTVEEKEHIERTCHCGETVKDFDTLLKLFVDQNLYYYDEGYYRSEYVSYCDAPLIWYKENSGMIYFVTESKPTILYRIQPGKQNQPEQIYQSGVNEINSISLDFLTHGYLLLVGDNKYCIQANVDTGEEKLITEMDFIQIAMWRGCYRENSPMVCESIWVSGRPTEKDPLSTYFYYVDTGEFQEHYG